MQEILPGIHGGEVVEESEAFKPRPRFLILGSRISGAYNAADAFEVHLKTLGIEDPRVQTLREATRIEDAFFDRLSGVRSAVANQQPLALEEAPTSSPHTSLVRRLTSFITKKEVTPPTDEAVSVPDGVVVFPQMRQYLPSGTHMFIPAPREDVQKLCDQHGVPVIFMEDIEGQTQLRLAIEAFTPQDVAPPTVEDSNQERV